MSEYKSIIVNNVNRVATITLNEPDTVNAISQQMRHDLLDAITKADQDDDVRIVVINAEGRGFSAGTNLAEGLAGFETIEDQIREEYKPFLMAIDKSDKLFISSIHGVAAGIGAAFAMTCDLTVMAEGAFIYLPFAGLSLVPDGGASFHAVKAMGYKRAMQWYAESGRMQAEDCLKYGLTNKVVAADKLKEETQAWAEQLAQGAPLAQKFGKQCLKAAHNQSLEEVLDMEAHLQVTCTTSKDYLAAVNAFFNKEKAEFKGE